jgi:HlyD family secretion protein
MAKKKKIILIFGGVLILVVFIILAIVRTQEKLIPVTVETVERGEITSIVTANGKVEAKTKVNISADVMGRILNMPIVEGQNVERNQLLVEIDKTQNITEVTQVKAVLASAKVDQEQAVINFQRQQQLYDRNLISQAEYDLARTNLERAKAVVEQYQANLDRALDQLEKCTIRAPMAGTITQLNSEVGENVILGTMNNPGTVIMVISDLSEIVVEAEVDETDIAQLALDQKVEISLDAFPDTTFNGKVTEIGNAAQTSVLGTQDQVTSFEVTILFTDKVPGIKPGMNASVDITTNVRQDVIKIPIQAVVMRKPTEDTLTSNQKTSSGSTDPAADTIKEDKKTKGKTVDQEEEEIDGVFWVKDKVVKFVPVKTGISDQQYIEIKSGLAEEQQIVTGSYKTLRTLKNGDKVKAKEKSYKELSSSEKS